ncbi:addiction module toxin, HicA family [Marinihelvus fidelis]|uniref:Addiction module toxin, HicA family n=1 Tax=Marinihelvus fidelis TaxID=2613842 RepID=A0A5N0T903_9GAMM|nr:addiction module toxin, HicA family [Marinihelvus fidelis]
MPPKIRQLEVSLRKAGFTRTSAKGSHRKYRHPCGLVVFISGHPGADAETTRSSRSGLRWTR